jgi:hypothetical protein
MQDAPHTVLCNAGHTSDRLVEVQDTPQNAVCKYKNTPQIALCITGHTSNRAVHYRTHLKSRCALQDTL